jgi:hypothetical protein
MTTLNASPANARRVAQAQAALIEILAEIMQHGYFGTAAVELNVQDGTIQHIRRKLERMEK